MELGATLCTPEVHFATNVHCLLAVRHLKQTNRTTTQNLQLRKENLIIQLWQALSGGTIHFLYKGVRKRLCWVGCGNFLEGK